MKHIAKKCNVRGCKNEADSWICTDKLSGDFDVSHRSTFYLCEDCREELGENDGFISFLNPETGKIRQIEVGIYCCSNDCLVCNQ